MLKYKWIMTGNQWQITNNNGLSFTVPNYNGMFYLSELILNPTHQIEYTKLISKGLYKKPNLEFQHAFKFELLKYGFHEENWYNAIPMADKKTIHEVAKEILHVREQIAQLEVNHDLGRNDLLESELSKLEEYLRSVFTRRKRIKMFRGEEDKLRDCVKKSLQRVYKYLRIHDRELAAFLSRHIHLYSNYIQMEPYSEYEFIFMKV